MDRKINDVRTDNITYTNYLINSISISIVRRLCFKAKIKCQHNLKEPWRKIWIRQSINGTRKDIDNLDRRKKKIKLSESNMLSQRKYRLKKTGINVVIDELNQRLKAKTYQLKRYERNTEQCRLHGYFEQNLERVYQELRKKQVKNRAGCWRKQEVLDKHMISGEPTRN